MPRTVIDSLGVVLELDDAPLFRGLQVADDAIERFRAQSRDPVPLAVVADLSPLEAALQQLPILDPVRVPVTLDTAALDLSFRALQDRLRGITAIQLEAGVDEAPVQAALTDLERLLTGFRGRAEAELALSGPTLDSTDTRAQLEQIVQAATQATDRLQALRTAVPAPDTTAAREALDAIVQGLARVEEGIAALNGARLRVDPGDLLAGLSAARSELERLTAGAGGITIPIRLDTESLPASLGAVERQLAALRPVAIPVTVDPAGVGEVLARVSRQLAGLAPVAVPVTVDAAGLTAGLREVADQLDALGGVTLPVRLDTAAFRDAVADVEQQVAGLGGVTLPATLDTRRLTAAIEEIRSQLDVGTVTVPVTLEAEAAFTALEQLETRLAALRDVSLRIRLDGAPAAEEEARAVSDALSPAGAERFGQATSQALAEVAQALAGLQTTLAAITGGVEGFFLGAAEALRELGASSQVAAAAQDDLATRTLAAAQSFREAGVAEENLNATLERSGFLSIQAAQAQQQEARATLQLAAARRQAALEAGAGPGAAAALVAPQGFDRLIQQQQAAARGGRAMADGLALASRQAQVLAEAAAAAATGSGRMTAGFALASEQARLLAAAEDRLALASGRASVATAAHGLGSRQAALHFVTFAASTVGLDSAIARTAASVAIAGSSFTGIGTIVTGVSLAVIAGAEAWNLFSRAQREAKEETEKNKEAIARLREVQKGPVVQARESFDIQRAEVERLSRALANLAVRQREAATIPAGRTGIPSLAAQNDLLRERRKLLEDLAKASSDLAVVQQALTEAESREHGAELLRSLDQEVQSFGLGEIAARKLALTLDQNLSAADRQAALSALDHLGALQAQRRAMEESLATTERLAQAQFKQLQQQVTTPLAPETLSFRVDTGSEGLRLFQTEIQDTVDLLDRMRTGLDQTSDAAKVLASKADSFRALGTQIEDAIRVADAAPLRLLTQTVGDLASRLDLLRTGFAGVGPAQQQAAQTAGRLGQAYAQLLVEIERQGGPLRASTDSLRAATQAAEALARADVRGSALGTLAEQLAQAEGRLREFVATAGQGFPELRLRLELDVQAAEQARDRFFAELRRRADTELRVRLDLIEAPGAEGVAGSLTRVADGTRTLNDELTRTAREGSAGFREMEARAERLRRALEDLRTPVQRLNDAIHDVTRGLDDVAGAARNVGLIGDEASRAIGSVLDLGDAIGSVIESASSGNILGLVGAGINLVGGLFGGGESEHDRIVRENTAAIQRNTAALAEGAGGLASLGTSAASLAANRALFGLASADRFERLGFGKGAREEIDKIFAEAGTTVEAFAAQVKAATGIEILDEKGNIVAEAFQQAKEAIDQVIEAVTHFGTSLSARAQQLETRDALGLGPSAGLPDNLAALNRTRELELGGLKLDPALEARIAALDLATEEGRKAFLEFNRMLFTLAANGQLTAEQLQTFQSVDELLGPIHDAADLLDSFNQGLARATLAQAEATEALRRRLFGAGEFDAAAQFESQIAGLAQLAPDFARQFQELGTIGPEDQAAIRQFLQQGFRDLIAGIIPEGLTADELQQFLEQGASALDVFNQKVTDAGKRLGDLNIPQGFRRAALAFQVGDRGPDRPGPLDLGGDLLPLPRRALEPATDEFLQTLATAQPGVGIARDFLATIGRFPLVGDGAALPDFGDLTRTLSPLGDTLPRLTEALPDFGDLTRVLNPLGDTLPRLTEVLATEDGTLRRLLEVLDQERAGPRAVPAAGPVTQVTIQIAPGAIVIHAAPGQDPQQIAQAVLGQFRTLAMAQTGDTLQLGSFT